jgi:hypothetical protein
MHNARNLRRATRIANFVAIIVSPKASAIPPRPMLNLGKAAAKTVLLRGLRRLERTAGQTLRFNRGSGLATRGK